MYDTYENDTAKYRILLEKWSPKLHPNHFQVEILRQTKIFKGFHLFYIQVLLLKKRIAISMNGTLSFDQVNL